MKHSILPLFCSTLELIGKVIFALWIVPAKGYLAVYVCEPVTWVICMVVIVAGALWFKSDFRDSGQSVKTDFVKVSEG